MRVAWMQVSVPLCSRLADLLGQSLCQWAAPRRCLKDCSPAYIMQRTEYEPLEAMLTLDGRSHVMWPRQPAEADAGPRRAALHWRDHHCRVPQVRL